MFIFIHSLFIYSFFTYSFMYLLFVTTGINAPYFIVHCISKLTLVNWNKLSSWQLKHDERQSVWWIPNFSGSSLMDKGWQLIGPRVRDLIIDTGNLCNVISQTFTMTAHNLKIIHILVFTNRQHISMFNVSILIIFMGNVIEVTIPC